MMEKIKIIFGSVQMRNAIYLFLGFIFSVGVISKYKLDNKVKQTEKVEQSEKNEQSENIKDILKEYSLIDNFEYKIYYEDIVINGVYSNNTFFDDVEVENIKVYEDLIVPQYLYNLLENRTYTYNLDYKYEIDDFAISIHIENEKIKKNNN